MNRKTKSRRLPPGARKKVQGDWNLSHSIEELRENVFVGETALKDLSEERIEFMWTNEVGTKNFREALKREVVFRVNSYFKAGLEKEKRLQESVKKKNALAESLSTQAETSLDKNFKEVDTYLKSLKET